MSTQATDNIEKEELTRLLDRIGRMARGLQYCHGLNPAQWDCLRFIGQANRFSRTPGALAAFLGTTKGTASQTLKALEKKGYLTRVADPDDKRVRHIELTNLGANLLSKDPLNCLDRAIDNLPSSVADTMAAGLAQLCNGMQSRFGGQDLGICHECGHFAGPSDTGNMICGLKSAELSCEDAKRFCVNFSPETERS
ncbi:MAG: MarR family transcriptional regulator [Alphaproteobacteria bacterium]|nr:MarR family transcriptional regulator [Alphaproteobacteria bacterium]|tara:strand:+ start:1271 stop:1858 length:588 start_codon:yes stop_codon:yes gene_type:complete